MIFEYFIVNHLITILNLNEEGYVFKLKISIIFR